MTARLVAVDVGTASVRAAVIDEQGTVLGRGLTTLPLRNAAPARGVYASERLWEAVCAAVRTALDAATVVGSAIAAIGFDATSSLVLRDRAGRPCALDGAGDTIAWFDHRAHAEASAITSTGHGILASLGGVMSPEMQLPKLLWLKRHRCDLWRELGLAFDLADFLTWRATGAASRSRCTLVSKWAFDAGMQAGWPLDLLAELDVEDVLDRAALPATAAPVGGDLGTLRADSAAELGLSTRCRVAAGLVDAHAGALAVVGGATNTRSAALIAGTSTCVMALSALPLEAPGLWGPHWATVLPSRWTQEAGQSASGALLDHLVEGSSHATTHRAVIERIVELRRHAGADLAPRLHVLPEFRGRRSPVADPSALGVVSGLELDGSFDGLCRLYWRAAVAIALGVGEVVELFARAGLALDTLHVAGGHVRNPLLMQLYADATGCVLQTARGGSSDGMLLGGAIGAAVAAGIYPSVGDAAAAMAPRVDKHVPNPEAQAWLARDREAQRLLREQRRALDALTFG